MSDFDWDADFITKPKENFSSSDSDSSDSTDIDKIKIVAQKVIDDNLAYWDLEVLLKDVGFEVKQKMNNTEIDIIAEFFRYIEEAICSKKGREMLSLFCGMCSNLENETRPSCGRASS